MSFYYNVEVLLYGYTKGFWLLDRAKVFTIPPLLVQTISLWDEVLPPPNSQQLAFV